jgi:exodeoxyribonuclease V beta subunit
MSTSTPNIELELTTQQLINGLVAEASAGTGKTYSVAALLVRELATKEDLRISEVLITTFTRTAAAELRDRIRGAAISVRDQLRQNMANDDDEIAKHLINNYQHDLAVMIQRLDRALVEFDSATISTIHSVCTKILHLAGVSLSNVGDDDITSRVVAEAVNDAVISRSVVGLNVSRIDPKKIAEVITKLLADPFTQPWLDPEQNPFSGGQPLSEDDQKFLNDYRAMIQECKARVQDATINHPSFNDLLKRAHDVVTDSSRAALIDDIRSRFKLAIVDEAQDTDKLQWAFFDALFPPDQVDRALIAVGDPKQAIFGFRGADVRAFVLRGDPTKKRTLTTNHRSDKPVLDALNAALDGAMFGDGISYISVNASSKNSKSRFSPSEAVEFVDVGEVTSQNRLDVPAARVVHELLTLGKIKNDGTSRDVEPRDICVLVRTKATGRAIERKLKQFKIPAVSNGTESVMEGAMANHLRSLFELMERLTDVGRTRRAAATPFFGLSLRHESDITDVQLQKVQNRVNVLRTILQSDGVAALAGAISADEQLMTGLTKGSSGERYITDFAHVMDVLHVATQGKATSPTYVLEQFMALIDTDSTSDLVSRRVESDVDAVQIMTIHSAKGLQFPCVVVADLWKPSTQTRGAPVFYLDDQRVVDISHGLTRATDASRTKAKDAVKLAEQGEMRRLMYVALTRTMHHLSVLVTDDTKSSLSSMIPQMPAKRLIDSLVKLETYQAKNPKPDAKKFVCATAPATITQSYRRTSFSGIMDIHTKSQRRDYFDLPSHGNDEFGTAPDNPALGNPAPDSPAPADAAESLDALKGFAIPVLPASKNVGNQIHDIFEIVDTSVRPLRDEVARAVQEKANSSLLRGYHQPLTTMLTRALETPFGGAFGDVCFADISPQDRLAEMDFEMTVALSSANVLTSDIGRVLLSVLSPTDVLRDYALALTDSSFDIQVAGLINGSLDALLRLPGSTPTQPLLAITDYKSNKLHRDTDTAPIANYSPRHVQAKMQEAHYILQALIYGTSIYRMLRWRLPGADHDACIKGIAYGFIRGMVGPDTPTDENGHRYGVFTWQAPTGLWRALSDLFAGSKPA